MSGPVTLADTPAVGDSAAVASACVQLTDDRRTTVGRISVRRALPHHKRRTVGPWCFADHMGPAHVTETSGLDIAPHPHIGLQTVTWLAVGEVLHRDSLGCEQVIAPGQLNLMTAGRGVSHSEEATRAYRGQLHGIQLWIALPEASRQSDAHFEHQSQLPRVETGTTVATVLIGELSGAVSPARRDGELVGVELDARPGVSVLPLRADFEYALIVLEGAVTVAGALAVPGRMAYLGRGRDELEFRTVDRSRAMLLGGEPLAEPIVMWWNFVARSRAEIETARADWQAGHERFGQVDSALPRIPAPQLPWRTTGAT